MTLCSLSLFILGKVKSWVTCSRLPREGAVCLPLTNKNTKVSKMAQQVKASGEVLSPEFNPQDPRGRRRELVLVNCLLIATPVLWCSAFLGRGTSVEKRLPSDWLWGNFLG